MHQLTLFAPTEPAPAPAKKSFKAKPTPTKESVLEVDPNIATKPPEPTQAEAPRLTQISPNQSPTVSAKPIVISYEISEPIAIGDAVMLRDGTVGTVKKYAYNDKELPTGVKPCQHEGLREIVVSTAAGERCVYAYQLQKITAPKPIKKEPLTVPSSTATGKILSFSITTERAAAMGVPDPLIAGIKICTRRAKWTAPTIAYYQRAYEEGLLIQAYSAMPFVTCKNPRKMADIRLTRRPYLEALGDMPEEDLIAEGGLWKTREEFIDTVCNGKPDPSLKVWVNWFEVVNICV